MTNAFGPWTTSTHTTLELGRSRANLMDPAKRRRPMWIPFGLACVIVAIARADVRADGLIYQLPADGAWVRYDVEMKSNVKATGMEPMQINGPGTLLLSSVGHKSVNGEPCRWIEFAFEMSPPGASKKFSRILKVLIPESRLKRGMDPFAHVRDMYYSQGGLLPEIPVERVEQSEKIDGADYSRQQYELDRLRSVFPRLLKDLNSERESVDTKLGKLDCEKLTGKDELSKSLLRGGGEWAWSGDFHCLLNEKVPFGVVRLRSQVKGFEKPKEVATQDALQVETEMILTVVEVGQGATSRLSTGK